MCLLLEGSPAWLLATWRVPEAEEAVMAAAKLNGLDEEKAQRGLQALLVDLKKLNLGEGTPLSVAEGILEAVRTRQRAVAAFASRFSASGLYLGLAVNDGAPGKLAGGARRSVHGLLRARDLRDEQVGSTRVAVRAARCHPRLQLHQSCDNVRCAL
ncbi:hypothetical protein HPB52_008876 [Rhipicephalus sanguineus]|uniref:Uncharacterized protein n=2 Tax=Rhipicephalus sanguineus TaxID=34632 RepID=A0A9D4PVG4_RHISA|nr:hypothetical protein HPB52_008876 [Rhipicephalus sanguineus]